MAVVLVLIFLVYAISRSDGISSERNRILEEAEKRKERYDKEFASKPLVTNKELVARLRNLSKLGRRMRDDDSGEA